MDEETAFQKTCDDFSEEMVQGFLLGGLVQLFVMWWGGGVSWQQVFDPLGRCIASPSSYTQPQSSYPGYGGSAAGDTTESSSSWWWWGKGKSGGGGSATSLGMFSFLVNPFVPWIDSIKHGLECAYFTVARSVIWVVVFYCIYCARSLVLMMSSSGKNKRSPSWMVATSLALLWMGRHAVDFLNGEPVLWSSLFGTWCLIHCIVALSPRLALKWFLITKGPTAETAATTTLAKGTGHSLFQRNNLRLWAMHLLVNGLLPALCGYMPFRANLSFT